MSDTPSPTELHRDPPLRLAIVACAVLEDEVRAHTPEGTEVVARVELEQGLHNEPPRLRAELQAAIEQLESQHATKPDALDGIVLGYGLCSRGVDGLCVTRVPLVVPRAHDCITVLLGGRERYERYVNEHPGTYWYSPGWNRHHTPPGRERYDKLYQQYVEKYGEDNAEFLMEQEQHWFKTYNRATYVHLSIGATDRDKAYTKRCADWLNWDYDEVQGDPGLLRDLLGGQWDHERFVVVAPGHRLVMTGDERILTTQPIDAVWDQGASHAGGTGSAETAW